MKNITEKKIFFLKYGKFWRNESKEKILSCIESLKFKDSKNYNIYKKAIENVQRKFEKGDEAYIELVQYIIEKFFYSSKEENDEYWIIELRENEKTNSLLIGKGIYEFTIEILKPTETVCLEGNILLSLESKNKSEDYIIHDKTIKVIEFSYAYYSFINKTFDCITIKIRKPKNMKNEETKSKTKNDTINQTEENKELKKIEKLEAINEKLSNDKNTKLKIKKEDLKNMINKIEDLNKNKILAKENEIEKIQEKNKALEINKQNLSKNNTKYENQIKNKNMNYESPIKEKQEHFTFIDDYFNQKNFDILDDLKNNPKMYGNFLNDIKYNIDIKRQLELYSFSNHILKVKKNYKMNETDDYNKIIKKNLKNFSEILQALENIRESSNIYIIGGFLREIIKNQENEEIITEVDIAFSCSENEIKQVCDNFNIYTFYTDDNGYIKISFKKSIKNKDVELHIEGLNILHSIKCETVYQLDYTINSLYYDYKKKNWLIQLIMEFQISRIEYYQCHVLNIIQSLKIG